MTVSTEMKGPCETEEQLAIKEAAYTAQMVPANVLDLWVNRHPELVRVAGVHAPHPNIYVYKWSYVIERYYFNITPILG